MSWFTSELRVRLAPLNRFKPSSKIFYWPFQGGTSFVDLLCFCSVLCLLCFVRVCLYVLRGNLLGKGWPLGSRLWCLLWVCHFPIGILGQVWYLIVSISDLCNLTYFKKEEIEISKAEQKWNNHFPDELINWKKIYSINISTSYDMKLQNFQYRYLNRIVHTNKFLTRCQIVSSSLCDFCNMDIETMHYLFWECIHVQFFWTKFRDFFKLVAS